jgi:hypothetical protein
MFAALAMLFVMPAPAAAPVPLAATLDRVGQQVQNFWNYFSAVTCSEALTQTKLDAKAKTIYEQKSSYDYLVLLQSTGANISVDESRIEKDRKSSKGKASLLLTDGFSILLLVFHPLYQSSYEFSELPDDLAGGRRLLRIGFQHAGGDRSPSALRLGEREYPLEWKGTAWIDPSTFAIVRIETSLGSSLDEIGLLQLDADVTYSSIHFDGAASTYWLPTRAVIEAATRRQRWRNTHLFSNYRRFSVETEVKTMSSQ